MKLYMKEPAPDSWAFNFRLEWPKKPQNQTETRPNQNKKKLWEEERGRHFHEMLFPWHQKCLWRGWEILHSQTTAGTVGKSENSLLWPDMCFISGEGMKALVMCYDISVSPQNALDIPTENVMFITCGGAGGRICPLLSVLSLEQSCSTIASFGGRQWVSAGWGGTG